MKVVLTNVYKKKKKTKKKKKKKKKEKREKRKERREKREERREKRGEKKERKKERKRKRKKEKKRERKIERDKQTDGYGGPTGPMGHVVASLPLNGNLSKIFAFDERGGPDPPAGRRRLPPSSPSGLRAPVRRAS